MDAINIQDRQWAVFKFITIYLLLAFISWLLWYTNRKAENKNKERCEKCNQEVKNQIVELDKVLLLIKYVDSSLQSKANIISTNDEQETTTTNSMLSYYNENIYKLSRTEGYNNSEILIENTKKIADLKNLLFQLHTSTTAHLNTVNEKRPKFSNSDEKNNKKEEDLKDAIEEIGNCTEFIKEKNKVLEGINEDLITLKGNIEDERKYRRKVLDKILDDAIKEINGILSEAKRESRKAKF